MLAPEVKIGELTLQPFRQVLTPQGPMLIGRKALEILSVLATANGALVTKDELMQAVWPDVFVADNAIQVHVMALRKLLGDDAGLLTTVRGLGYRLHLLDAEIGPGQKGYRPDSVAVLPFANLTKTRSLDALCDGIAEELINTLCQTATLKVPAHTSSFAYRGRNVDAREIGRHLDVATILEGSIRCAGEHLRVTAQLVSADSGYHLWSQSFDRDAEDVLALEAELAETIWVALKPYLQLTSPPQIQGAEVNTAKTAAALLPMPLRPAR